MTADFAGRFRSRRRPRLARETVVAVDVGPGFDLAPPGASAASPALVRAHDEATGTLMATATAARALDPPPAGSKLSG